MLQSRIVLVRYGTDEFGKPVKKAIVWTKNEHNIQKNKIDNDAILIINRLNDAGFHSYIVGGAVRDLIAGLEPKDFDVVTDATPSKIKRLFRNSRVIGRRFKIVHVFFGPKIFEVSTFRSTADGTTIGNKFGTIDEDVHRRDFTINALYYDPIQEQIVDYVGGVRDIKKGILRPIIPLEKIFTEDPVRMIRAVKYSVKTNAKISFSLHHKIKSSAFFLSRVSASRLTEEFMKIINSGSAENIVFNLIDCDLYKFLQPEASKMIATDKNFEKSYMQNLKKLDELVQNHPDFRLGQKFVFLLKDFIYSLEEIENAKKQTDEKIKINYNELYDIVWAKCRKFVLPINPQRTELDFAIKLSLQELGITGKVRKNRTRGRYSREKTKTA